MKQQLDLVVVTYIDHDKQRMTQDEYEKALQRAIAAAVREVLGTPLRDTEIVDFSYGDPV